MEKSLNEWIKAEIRAAKHNTDADIEYVRGYIDGLHDVRKHLDKLHLPYSEMYAEMDRKVNAELAEISKGYDYDNRKPIKCRIEGKGVFDDTDVTEMWYDEETGEVYFRDTDDYECSTDNMDLSYKISLLEQLLKN